MKTKPKLIGLGFVALTVAVFAYLIQFVAPLRTHYEDFGIILVESPEVYSRERLVNDRFQQHAWLEGLLNKTAEMEFGSEIQTSSERLVEFAAFGAVGKPTPSPGNSSAPMDKNTPASQPHNLSPEVPENSFFDTLAIREVIRTEVMETLLDDRHDLKGNTLYRLKFDVTLIPRMQTNKNDPLALVQIRLKNPYSDKDCPWEDSNKSLCPTEADCPLSDECAALKASLHELYTRWIVDVEESLQREQNYRIENYIRGQIEGSEASKMYRFYADVVNTSYSPASLTTAVENIGKLREKIGMLERGFPSRSPPKASNVRTVSHQHPCELPVSDPHSDACINTYFRTLVPYDLMTRGNPEQDQVRTAMLLYMYFLQDNQTTASCSPDNSMPYGDQWCHYLQQRTPSKKKAADLWRQWESDIDAALAIMSELEAKRNFSVRYKKMCRMLSPEATCNQSKVTFPVSKEPGIETMLDSIRELSGNAVAIEKQLLNNAITDYMLYTFALKKDLGMWADFGLSGCGIGNCTLVVAPYGNLKHSSTHIKIKANAQMPDTSINSECIGCKRWFQKLNMDVELFSYAITPKGRVQRIGDISRQKDTRQLNLQAAATLPNQPPVEGGANWTDSAQQLVNQVKRHPTVVGFGPQRMRNAASETTFGWLLGPRFADIDAGKYSFRHVPVQHSLSAVVSLPSWWHQADINVTTCWLDPANSELWLHIVNNPELSEALCKTDQTKQELPPNIVRLPATTTDIPRKLRYSIGRIPFVDRPKSNTIADVAIGESARIVIEGGDLWRSTVVTLGAQQATKVTVLPNMEGVIAEFKEIEIPDKWNLVAGDRRLQKNQPACSSRSDLVVWTSEGKTAALPVRVWLSRQELLSGTCIKQASNIRYAPNP